MIQLNRNHSSQPQLDVRIKIVGLGGAGSNALDRIQLDGLAGAELVAINTDVRSLTGSVAPEKVQLGRATTRGLGAGGDPEIGYAAAEEGIEEIRRALEGAQMIFLCVGLGGGTGCGAARIVAAAGREQSALVIAFATLPFAFEGKRRRAQADEALSALQETADVVICFENDRMADGVSPLAGIADAFAAADQTISQSVRAIAALTQQRGLVHLGFDELVTTLRCHEGASPRCLFGYGEADGDNRANEALGRALKNPLMSKGRMLDGAREVLVNVAGGTSMTLNEVQILMEELNRHIGDETRIHFGAVVDPRLGSKMSVTILSALEGALAENLPAEPAPRLVPRIEIPTVPLAAPASAAIPRLPEIPPLGVEPRLIPKLVSAPSARGSEPPQAAPRITFLESAEAPAAQESDTSISERQLEPVATAAEKSAAKAKAVAAKQEQMQFEPVTRGRFEKSEPTIVDGQDLDVPTFMRRNVKVK